MKKSLFALVLILHSSFFVLHSQEDVYRIEQAFPVAIRQLTVVSGWTIKLIYTPGEDSTRVTVVTPCPYYFEEGNEPQVCALEEDRMHIRDNRSMPQGTLLEIRYPEPMEIILTAGYVELDTVHMLLHSNGPRAAGILVGRNSTLKINYLVSTGDIGVECHERTHVDIGTVRCRQFIVDENQRDRIKVEHLEIDSLVVVPHHWWHDINWANNKLFIGGKMGAAGLIGYKGPYTSSVNLSINLVGRFMEAPLSPRWHLTTGFGAGFEWTYMSYDVILDDDKLIFNPNHTIDHYPTVLARGYLSIPLSIQYRTKNKWARLFCNHFDITLTPMLNLFGNVTGYRNDKFYSENTDLFSRFQLRLGFSNTMLASVRDDIISGGITWEIFVDLLPTYRPSAGAKGYHQIGFVLHF